MSNNVVRVNVARFQLDALLIKAGSNDIGHRGIWGIPRDTIDVDMVVPGSVVEFLEYGDRVIERGVIVELMTFDQAQSAIGHKACSRINDFWFRWRDSE